MVSRAERQILEHLRDGRQRAYPLSQLLPLEERGYIERATAQPRPLPWAWTDISYLYRLTKSGQDLIDPFNP
ncbi:hypothetical protein [Deinococcus sonorensis]|uniref:Uncharacterized protein n=2 Tax=Deinococcus sonorensis TaxID=309891 RepID=A0AAU7UB62_9DEIO